GLTIWRCSSHAHAHPVPEPTGVEPRYSRPSRWPFGFRAPIWGRTESPPPLQHSIPSRTNCYFYDLPFCLLTLIVSLAVATAAKLCGERFEMAGRNRSPPARRGQPPQIGSQDSTEGRG